jgi:hypothetical protein
MTRDSKADQATMADERADNVVHLGTGDLAAIGKVLRDMYDFYLQSKPPERLERLVAMIGQAGNEPTASEPDDAAPRNDATPTA